MSKEKEPSISEYSVTSLESGELSTQSRGSSIQDAVEKQKHQMGAAGEIGSHRPLVDWDGPDDPSNPMNWSYLRKSVAVLSICLAAFTSSFTSSVFAPAAVQIAEQFDVSQTVADLGVGLYVLGFAAGALPPEQADGYDSCSVC